MMSLLENAQESLARLTKIEAAREGVEETKALEGLRSELDTLAAPFKQLSDNANLLRKAGVGLSSMNEISLLVETVKNVATRFSEVPRSTTLRKGTRWTGLTKKLDEFAIRLTNRQIEDWGNYFISIIKCRPPEVLRVTLAHTPDNKKLLEQYTKLFCEVIQYKKQIPENADEFKKLIVMSEQLTLIKFEEDVPSDVQAFLKAVPMGADLDLLTNEVIAWLRSNNLLGSYHIRPRNN